MPSIKLTKNEYAIASHFARAAELGGSSAVRAAGDRSANLSTDQLVGQLGTVALHRYLFGHLSGYIQGRHLQNLSPTTGDCGEDIPGANVDVKCSVMRYGQDPLQYNLCVRPRERHPEWVYVLAMVGRAFTTDRIIHLVGWATDDELPAEPRADGPLAGAYVIPATELHPLPPINYNWFN